MTLCVELFTIYLEDYLQEDDHTGTPPDLDSSAVDTLGEKSSK